MQHGHWAHKDFSWDAAEMLWRKYVMKTVIKIVIFRAVIVIFEDVPALRVLGLAVKHILNYKTYF